MPEHPPSSELEIGSHPKGTLFIVAVYGVLLVLGWLAIFLFTYVPRGVVTR